jgi:hypothetical protein
LPRHAPGDQREATRVFRRDYFLRRCQFIRREARTVLANLSAEISDENYDFVKINLSPELRPGDCVADREKP